MKGLNWILVTLIALGSLLFTGVAFAQDGSIGDLELISGLIEMAKDLKGASTLVIVGTVIQAFILFSKHSWSNFLGKWKLVIVALASFAGIFITGKIQGLEMSAIIADSATLTAFQVLINQIFKQSKKND
jgi:hypothetical protein